MTAILIALTLILAATTVYFGWRWWQWDRIVAGLEEQERERAGGGRGVLP